MLQPRTARHAPVLSPRLLCVDLERLVLDQPVALEPSDWCPADGGQARVAAWSGPALALVRWLERAGSQRRPWPLALAVGEAVRRGLPTAARASVLGVAPLSGRLVQAQVGGELAAALAPLADVLWIEGRTEVPGALLVLDGAGRAVLRSRPEWRGLATAVLARRLRAEHPSWTSLRVGPAGEQGVRFANLAGGEEPESFVGRGGLGAAFAALGLKALLLERGAGAAAVESAEQRALVEKLRASPRLAERASGGTFELAEVLAVRGLWSGASTAASLAPAQGFVEEGRDERSRTHGCRGCPTPCGWVFRASDGGQQGARLSAVQPLGPGLSLARAEEALGLLELCDALGVDAKEAGASLALLSQARERGLAPGHSALGDAQRLQDDLLALARPEDERALLMKDGARALAERTGLEAAWLAAGEALRPETDLGALLGAAVGVRGAEPMRSFLFTSLASPGACTAALLAPLALAPGSLVPRSPTGKGRLVAWHEDLAAALDATGFCAFSAAGLLLDGLIELDELARAIAPFALEPALGARPGRALLAAGASLCLVQAEVDARLGYRAPAAPERIERWLAQPGMRAEYERVRGLRDGRPEPEAWAALASERLLELGEERVRASAEALVRAPETRPVAVGVVRLRGLGSLKERLGGERELALELPASLESVLRRAAEELPGLRDLMESGAAPAVLRAGSRLELESVVEAGDVLDLLLAIAGG